jgi:transposase
MDIVVERCAGLDVHKDTVVAYVRSPGEGRRREEVIVTFGTTTVQLLALRDWLVSMGVTLVGMESTGVCWKPVYYVLEDAIECWLLNAQHLRNVPGRKTDVADAAWICQLVEHGLVRPSFVPPKPIRELRNLCRYRRSQIEERTREAQRLDKVLQDAGIKLSSVLGLSGRAMLDAAGTRDPEVLADLAKGTLRKKIPMLRDAFEGRFGAHHGLLIGQILAKLDFLDEAIANLSAEIDRVIDPFEAEVALLVTIPGIERRSAQELIAEIGVDMTRFPSAARGAEAPHLHRISSGASRASSGVLVDEGDRVADRLGRPVVVAALPEHEPLPSTRNRIEEHVSVLSEEDLVLGHVEHEHLRIIELRAASSSVARSGGSSIPAPVGMPPTPNTAALMLAIEATVGAPKIIPIENPT